MEQIARSALSFFMVSLTMTLIIFVIMVINALFGKAFPARVRYAVWIIILVGLIMPLRPVIGNGIINIPLPSAFQMDMQNEIPGAGATGAEITVATAPGLMSLGSFVRSFVSSLARGFVSVSGLASVLVSSLASGFAHSPAHGSVHDVAHGAARDLTFLPFILASVIIWSIIALIVFSYHIWRYIRFLRMIRRWSISIQDGDIHYGDILSAFNTVRTDMGLIGKRFELIICGVVSSSMLIGLRRPTIILPDKEFTADELEIIFRHELIHYKRHDLFVNLMSVIALSMHWYNPFVYWMCMKLYGDGEASCDEAVLANIGNENRRFYAEAIIRMIDVNNAPGTMLSTCLYNRKSGLKSRLESILDTTQKKKSPTAIILAGVILATALSGSIIAFSSAIQFGDLTVEQALEAARSIVGGGIIEEIKLDRSSSTLIYEIEGKYDNMKYEMDINSSTGDVIRFSEKETKSAAPGYDDPQLTFTETMEIALEEIGGGVVEYIEFEDDDNGDWYYEVTLRHNGRKYEVYIEPDTGAITRIK